MKFALTTTSYGYSRRHRALEVFSIAAGLTLMVSFAVVIPRTIHSAGGWVNLVLTALTAYIASDVISGFFHWSGDTIGTEQLWFLGPNFIRPFREHHVDPKGITRHDFIETNGNNCIIMCGPLFIAFLVMPRRECFTFFGSTFVAFLCLATVATNQFHKWAHLDHPPAPARWLQRWGLILSPHHHAVHHARPHDTHYCITVGWMNPVLNGVRFFRALEWLISRTYPTWLHIEDRRLFAALSAQSGSLPMGRSGGSSMPAPPPQAGASGASTG